MPFRTPQFDWIRIDHIEGKISCSLCDATLTYRTVGGGIGGLELLMDNLQPFAVLHDHRRKTRRQRREERRKLRSRGRAPNARS